MRLTAVYPRLLPAMNRKTLILALLIAASLGSGVQAQRSGISAREALGLVSTQFGPQATQWIAEVRAQGGIPQPNDWQVLAFDQRAPRLLYRFWAGGGRAGDGGIDEVRYPDDVPVGYFTTSQISLDSVAAFTIAEGEARKARMSFDSCDYLLRLREFSNEPVWRLELLDGSRRLVGKLYISASNGEVLRTVWVYRDQNTRPDGSPLIVDSAAPGGQNAGINLSSSGFPGTGSTGSLPGSGSVIPPIPPGIETPPPTGQVPGSMSGIHSVPLPPAPGVAVAGNQPYAPVDPNGRPMTSPTAPVDNGIPSPPPLTQAPAPAPVVPAPAPAPTVDPTKPPIKPSSSGGDSERIPPPPIPR